MITSICYHFSTLLRFYLFIYSPITYPVFIQYKMLGSVLCFMDVAVSYSSHPHGTSNPVEGKDENK